MRSIKKLSVLLCLCMILLLSQSTLADDVYDVAVYTGATEAIVPLIVAVPFSGASSVQFTVKTSTGLDYQAFEWSTVLQHSGIKYEQDDKNGDRYISSGTSDNFYLADANGYLNIGNLVLDYIPDTPETVEILNLRVSRVFNQSTIVPTTFNSIYFNLSRVPNNSAKLSLKGPSSVVSYPGATATYTLSVEGMPSVSGIELGFDISDDFLSYLNNSGYNSPNGYFSLTAGSNNTPLYLTDNNDGTLHGILTLLHSNLVGTSGDIDLLNFTFGVIPDVAGDIEFKLTNVRLSFAGETVASQIDQANNTVSTTFIDPATLPTPTPTPDPTPTTSPTPPSGGGGGAGGPGTPIYGNDPELVTAEPPADDEDTDTDIDIDDEGDDGLPGGPADVEKLVYIPFINGYPDGTVQPDGMLTRAELAQILYNLHSGGSGSFDADYTDMTQEHWAYNAIGFCQANDFMIGYPEGDFRPEATVTRAEVCTTIVRLAGLELTDAHPFADVGDHWGNEYIGAAYVNGLVQGYPDGTFRPDDDVTRAEAVAMICRAEGRDEKLFDLYKVFSDNEMAYWAYEYVMNAANGYNYYDMG